MKMAIRTASNPPHQLSQQIPTPPTFHPFVRHTCNHWQTLTEGFTASPLTYLHLLCMRLLTALFCIGLFPASLAAQDSTAQVVQFSGIVVTGDSLLPVPFTAVYRQEAKRGTSTDYTGFYSMPVMTGDTIVFSNIGFRPEVFVVPQTVKDGRISLVKQLVRDTLSIPTAFVYPWPTPEQFRAEFLSLNLRDNEAEIGRQNLESILLYDRMIYIGSDSGESFKIAMNQQAQKLYANGQLPQQNLFNPIAWAQFLKALGSGDLKRQ